MFSKFYSGKTALVTGHTGFKGACHGSPRYHDVLVWVWRIMHEYQASNEVER